jgi:hypothetical protein
MMAQYSSLVGGTWYICRDEIENVCAQLFMRRSGGSQAKSGRPPKMKLSETFQEFAFGAMGKATIVLGLCEPDI